MREKMKLFLSKSERHQSENFNSNNSLLTRSVMSLYITPLSNSLKKSLYTRILKTKKP